MNKPGENTRSASTVSEELRNAIDAEFDLLSASPVQRDGDVVEARLRDIAECLERPLYNPLEAGFRHSPLTLRERAERFEQACTFAAQDIRNVISRLEAPAATAASPDAGLVEVLARKVWEVDGPVKTGWPGVGEPIDISYWDQFPVAKARCYKIANALARASSREESRNG